MAGEQTSFDIIKDALITVFGQYSTPDSRSALNAQCKAIGWTLSETGFCLLRASRGTIVVPWFPEVDGRFYLATHIDLPRADRKGRSTAIASSSRFLRWEQTIAYLDIWTEFDLNQLIKLIELREMRRSAPNLQPPDIASPSLDGLPLPLTPVFRAVMFRDGGRCVECSNTENLHFDHLIPRSRGGADSFENLRVLCARCNLRKSNRV